MLQSLKNRVRSKLIPIILMILGAIIFYGTTIYWGNTCVRGGCSEAQMSGLLDPIKSLALMLVVLIFPFIFLKKHFFIAWLKWLAAPIALITAYAVATTEATPQGAFPAYRADVVETLTWVWLIVTLGFLFIYHYRRQGGQNSRQ